MPRNPKCRKICLTPSCRIFQGASGQAAVELRLDELEALRLVDLRSSTRRRRRSIWRSRAARSSGCSTRRTAGSRWL